MLFMTLLSVFWAWWTHGNTTSIIVILTCFAAGVGLGVALWFMPRFGQAVTGVIAGAVLGMQIFGVTMACMGSRPASWLLLTLVGGFATAGVFLGSFLRTYFFMTTTAYLGAFLVVRGFGNLMGNYPNVISAPVIENTTTYLIYIGVIVLVAVAGYFTQVVLKAKWPSAEDSASEAKNPENGAEVEVEVEVGGDAPVEQGGEAPEQEGGEEAG